MKGSHNLAELKQQREELEGWVKHQPCMVCTKKIAGAYGQWANGWTCSAKCEEKYNAPLPETENADSTC